MADDPQISIASLKADVDRMRFCGFWPARIECGPMVFELLVDWVVMANRMPPGDCWDEERILAREERMRQELRMGLTDMTFNGIPVSCHDDVPDGRMWPPRDKGGLVVPPFMGTEASHVSP